MSVRSFKGDEEVEVSNPEEMCGQVDVRVWNQKKKALGEKGGHNSLSLVRSISTSYGHLLRPGHNNSTRSLPDNSILLDRLVPNRFQSSRMAHILAGSFHVLWAGPRLANNSNSTSLLLRW